MDTEADRLKRSAAVDVSLSNRLPRRAGLVPESPAEMRRQVAQVLLGFSGRGALPVNDGGRLPPENLPGVQIAVDQDPRGPGL